MKIKAHYHLGETLQRSLVEVNSTLYRRIARWVVPSTGELDPTTYGLPVWQEGIHTGEFQNVYHKVTANLEKAFLDAITK